MESDFRNLLVTNIEWDGGSDLPSEMRLVVPLIHGEELEDFVSESLSDITSFCPKNFVLGEVV
jgi:hypothetical protein